MDQRAVFGSEDKGICHFYWGDLVQIQHQRILVTGASGFVGTSLVPALQDAFKESYILACCNSGAVGNNKLYRVDLTNDAATRIVVNELKPTHVIHLAGITHVKDAREDSKRAWRVNLNGTLNLAHAVLDIVPKAAFIHISTSDVYGRSFSLRRDALDESACVSPLNVYAATKAAADIAIGQMSVDGLHGIRLRPFNHTGPGQSREFVVPGIAWQIARIKCGIQSPVVTVGNTEVSRDFLDVRDVVRAYVETVRHARNIRAGAILNIASGIPRRIGDVVKDLASRISRPIEIISSRGNYRPNDVLVTAGDAKLAEDVLGWRPQIPWEVTLDDTLDYFYADNSRLET